MPWETDDIPYHKVYVDNEDDQQALAEALAGEGTEIDGLDAALCDDDTVAAEATILRPFGDGDYALRVANQLAATGRQVSVLEYEPGYVGEVWRGSSALELERRRDVLRRVLRSFPLEAINAPNQQAVSVPTPQIITAGSLRAIRLADFLREPKPAIRWSLDRIVPVGGLAIWAGKYGSIKSWQMMDLLLSIAEGIPWLDTFDTAQGPVLYIDAENGPQIMDDRLTKLIAGRGYDSESPFYVQTAEMIDLALPNYMGWLESLVEQIRPVAVVLDSLNTLCSADDISSKEMRPVLVQLKHLALTWDTAIYVIHHFRKGGQGADDIKGSVNIPGIADSVVLVRKDDKRLGQVGLTHHKGRWGKEVEPFGVELVEEANGDVHLEYLASQVAGPQVVQAKQVILSFLQQAGETERPAIIRHVVSQVKCKDRTAAEAVSRLHKDRLIQRRNKGHPAIYGLAGSP